MKRGILVLIAAFAASQASAQQIDPERLKEAVQGQVPQLARPELRQPPLTGEGSEAGTAWIAPLMLNHPGTIGGEPYTVNGKRQRYDFSFSIINPDRTAAANAGVDCFSADGQADPKYAARFSIAPLNAHTWRSEDAVPAPTTNGHADEDWIWCRVWASQPVFAFGVRSSEFGSERAVTDFSLLKAAD